MSRYGSRGAIAAETGQLQGSPGVVRNRPARRAAIQLVVSGIHVLWTVLPAEAARRTWCGGETAGPESHRARTVPVRACRFRYRLHAALYGPVARPVR